MSARSDAVQQQINEMRGSARAARYDIEKLTEQADDWQRKANEARKLAAVLEEKARIWDALADGLDSGALHDIAAPLGTGRDDRPSNTEMHALQGRLMAEVPDLDAWNIHCGELSAMLHRSVGGSRRAILGIAERYGIGYAEERRDTQVYVSAEGEIDDIPVKIWCLLPSDEATEAFVDVADAERTTLAEQLRARGAEQAAQDAENDAFHAQRRADEAEANGEYVDYDEAEAVRDIQEEMALEAAGIESWDQL